MFFGGTVVNQCIPKVSIESEEGWSIYISYMYDKKALTSAGIRSVNTQRNEEIWEAGTDDLSEH